MLEVTALDFPHGFNIPELKIRADLVPGKAVRARLTPERAGQFACLCDNFCGEGHGDMSGVLLVRAQLSLQIGYLYAMMWDEQDFQPGSRAIHRAIQYRRAIPMQLAPDFSIEPLAPSTCDEFFDYLAAQWSDNGVDGAPYFLPLPQGCARVPADKADAFRDGLGIPVGAPCWRRAWLLRSPQRQIVGHVDLRAHPERYAAHRCLLGMGVRREHRQRGLGTWLLLHAEEWALTHTALEWIDLQVLSANEGALHLYRASGFATTGVTPDLFRVDGRSLSDTSMSKRLPADYHRTL